MNTAEQSKIHEDTSEMHAAPKRSLIPNFNEREEERAHKERKVNLEMWT